MSDALFQTGLFFLYIFLGYLFKKLNLLKREDSQILAMLIMNLTLPCLFFSSANGMTIDMSFIIFMLLGLCSNLFMILISYLTSFKDDRLIRGTYMIACSGYDVGNFILPFVTAFFSSLGVFYLCSFNVMNVIMSMGITFALTCHIVNGQSRFDIKLFLKNLLSSLSFDVYILIIVIALFNIDIPQSIIKITSSIGSTNGFLVMFMIGLKLEFYMEKKEVRQLCYIISIRLIGGLILSIITLMLPIPPLAKKIFCITYFAPLISVSSIYTRKLGYRGNVVANANMLSIMISMVITTIMISLYI